MNYSQPMAPWPRFLRTGLRTPGGSDLSRPPPLRFAEFGDGIDRLGNRIL